jgi:ubiquinone/menaquinone biosynthesis C-methylase UbiE
VWPSGNGASVLAVLFFLPRWTSPASTGGFNGWLIKINDMKHIYRYYSPNDLYNKIMQGLEKTGKDLSRITLDDLQPVDEFHIRGDVATKELIKLSCFTPDMHILDVGCGVGGSTRRLSHETGCCVTGIDLSDEYIEAAERLTQLLNMQERVKFHAASALALPFDDNTFDGAWSIQMNMNIEDKPGWLKEVYRVLKPGGRAVLYEVCGNKNTPLHFPVPWAQDSSMSFLVPPESFRDVITSAGYYIDVWNDKTGLAQQAFAHMMEPAGEPDLPALGVHLLVGNDILTKAYNLHRNLDDERVSLIETVAVKPDS